MFGHFNHYLEHYFAPHPAREVREIFWSTAILDFAVAAVMVFEPVFLYSRGFSIPQILLFYAAIYVAYFFLLPFGGRICRRHGFEHTILWSSPFLILYYLSFLAINYDQAFIVLAGVFIVIQKVLYWPGYHSDFAAYVNGSETGREVADMSAMASLAAAMAPLIGGIIAASAGYPALFIVVAILILLSNIPLLRTPEIFVPRGFSYGGAIKRLVERKNRRSFLALLGFGEELYALAVWPLFIAAVVKTPFAIGTLTAISALATILVVLYVGRLSDEGDRAAVLRNGAVYTSGSWLVRLLAAGGLGIFLSDVFGRVAKNMMAIPLVCQIYDSARGNETETVVFFEMTLSVGKAVAAFAGAAIFAFCPRPWPVIFIAAAAFSLLYALMGDTRRHDGGTIAAVGKTEAMKR